ncbi:MAG: hypothetical protein V5A38_07855 [Halolamina sp.]|uniref:hypothetical protein n=1 Tax=Halolamina sp. TaxID=1940283 RepID=UPI002FC29E34
MSPTLDVVDRWDGGISWTLEEDSMHRTSHALGTDAGVWIIDPVDAPGLDDELDELGDVAGVTLLLDRHKRDSEVVARRHDVPVSLPAALGPVADELDAQAERYAGSLPGTEFRTVRLTNNRFWREVALFDADRGTLVVPEAVGTNELFSTSDERLGVHPVLRLFPPRQALGGLEPERVLVGHGPGVFDDAAAALRYALGNSRRNAPKLYAQAALTPFK